MELVGVVRELGCGRRRRRARLRRLPLLRRRRRRLGLLLRLVMLLLLLLLFLTPHGDDVVDCSCQPPFTKRYLFFIPLTSSCSMKNNQKSFPERNYREP